MLFVGISERGSDLRIENKTLLALKSALLSNFSPSQAAIHSDDVDRKQPVTHISNVVV